MKDLCIDKKSIWLEHKELKQEIFDFCEGYKKFINISRITASEKYLLNTEKSITEIAALCGFNDSNYFASVFKKIKGITPKKYSLMNK